MSNPKRIGNSYERDISYELSLWLTEGRRDDAVWRDASSGARSTVRAKKNKLTAWKADIIATDEECAWFFKKFWIDTKSYKDVNFVFINSKNSKSNAILNEWIKMVNLCPINMIPVMPLKTRNRTTPEFIFFPLYVKANKHLFMTYHLEDSRYDCQMMPTKEFLEMNTARNLFDLNETV